MQNKKDRGGFTSTTLYKEKVHISQCNIPGIRSSYSFSQHLAAWSVPEWERLRSKRADNINNTSRIGLSQKEKDWEAKGLITSTTLCSMVWGRWGKDWRAKRLTTLTTPRGMVWGRRGKIEKQKDWQHQQHLTIWSEATQETTVLLLPQCIGETRLVMQWSPHIVYSVINCQLVCPQIVMAHLLCPPGGVRGAPELWWQ